MSASDELQDMFPQFSRATILDVLDQAGDGAMDCLLELCADSREGSSLESSWSENSTNSWHSVNVGESVSRASKALTGVDPGEAQSRGWWSAWPQDGALEVANAKLVGRSGQKSDTGRSSAEGDVSDTWSEDVPSLYSGSVVVALTPERSDDDAGQDRGECVSFGDVSADCDVLTNGKNVVPLSDEFVGTVAGWDSVAEGAVNVFNWASEAGTSAPPANSGTEYWSLESETSSASGGDNDPKSESQKRRFLDTMFGEYGFGEDAMGDVLASVGGDVDSAVGLLLQLTKDIDSCPGDSSAPTGQAPWGQAQGTWDTPAYDSDFPALQHPRAGRGSGNTYTRGLTAGMAGPGRLRGRRGGPWARPRASASTSGNQGQADNTSWTRTPLNSSLHRKARALRQQFGNVPKEDFLVELLRDVGENVDTATTLLRESGLQETEGYQSPSSSSSQPPKRSPPPTPQPRPAQVLRQTVNTGMPQEEFQALYDQQRRKAIEYGELKDRSFKQAAEAYNKGQKDLAKRLSLQGQEYTRRAQFEHQRAAEAIFEKRNSVIVNTFTVDLHGMHVDEALDYVHTNLPEYKILDKFPTKKIVRFVTGKGKHSPDNVSRLSIALIDFFDKHSIHYSAGNGYIDVRLENIDLKRQQGS